MMLFKEHVLPSLRARDATAAPKMMVAFV